MQKDQSMFQRITIVSSLVAIGVVAAAHGDFFTVPGSNITVEIRNASDNPASQFSANEVTKIEKLLENTPLEYLKNIHYVESRPTPIQTMYSIPTDEGIAIYLPATPGVERPDSISGYTLAIPIREKIYSNSLPFGLPGNFEWNRLENHNFPNWFADSKSFFENQLGSETNAWNSAGLASWLYAAALFTDANSRTISLYADNGFTVAQVPITYEGNTLSFGPYRVRIEDNKVVAVQVSNQVEVVLHQPFDLSPLMVEKLLAHSTLITSPIATIPMPVPTLSNPSAPSATRNQDLPRIVDTNPLADHSLPGTSDPRRPAPESPAVRAPSRAVSNQLPQQYAPLATKEGMHRLDNESKRSGRGVDPLRDFSSHNAEAR